MSLFLTTYAQVAAIALVSTSLVIFSGCSEEADLPPSGTGGVPAATGGVPAATGGTPNPTGGTTGGAPVGGAGVGGTSGGGGGAPAAGAGAGGMSGPAGDPAAGKTIYGTYCSLCHGTDAVGGIGPNISGSVTAGIGAWTEAEFNRAVREAKGRTGAALCSLMTPSSTATISDVQLKDLHAYLLSVKSDTPNTGTSCP